MILTRSATAVLATCALAGCGGLSETEAIDSLTAVLREADPEILDAPLSDEQVACIATETVEELGPGIATKYEPSERPEFEQRDADALAQIIIDCTQAKKLVLDGIMSGFGESLASGGFTVTDEQLERARNCFEVSIDWTALADMASLEMQGRRDEAAAAGSNFEDDQAEVGANCAGGSVIEAMRQDIASRLTDEGFTPEQIECFDQHFDWDLFRQVNVAGIQGREDDVTELEAKISDESSSTAGRCR